MGSFDTRDLAAALRHAEAAARAAGGELAGRPPDWLGVDSDEGHDIKMAADRRSEAILARVLGATGLPIFSEEAGWIGGKEGSDFWLVDPLDGTANYASGVPLCCVSVALMSAGRPLVGIVYDFNRDELFAGAAGHGALLNGRPIHASSKTTTQSAILATGLTVRRDYSAAAMAEFAEGMARWKKIRMIGSAALSLAYVACGRFDAYRETSIMMWDVAAGWAVVEAAGGIVQAEFAGLSTPADVLAGNLALCAAVEGRRLA